MKKKLMLLLAAAMLFNGGAGQLSYAETATDGVSTVSAEEENIKRETGTTTVAATTNEWWMGNDKAAAATNAADYIAETNNTAGFNRLTQGTDVFVGHQMRKSTDDAPSYIILKDPDGAYLKSLTFYAYYRNTKVEDPCIISVSDTLAGPYTTVNTVSQERAGNLNGTNTHSIWKHTVTDIEAKYVKITSPTTTGSGYPTIGAFTYDWLKITDLSKLPDGTNTFKATTCPYWLADSNADALKPFAEYTVSARTVTASTDATELKSGMVADMLEFPVNKGDTVFIGVEKAGAYGIIAAPENSFMKRFKFYIYVTGSVDVTNTLSVSNEQNGTYKPVQVTAKRLGYIPGMGTNHYLYEVETADEINCKYAKITLPTGGYPKLGAIEYDYKINKVGVALDNIFYTYDDILNGQSRMDVKSDLNLFDSIELDGETYEIQWQSTDPQIIASDGTVNQPALTTNVKLNAKIYDLDSTEIYGKEYDLTVAALGSTLVFQEDFENFESEKIDEATGVGSIIGYNGWSGSYTPISNGGVVWDPSDASNKTLWTYRAEKEPSTGSDNNECSYDKISTGKVELNFKHKTTATSTQSRFGWCGMDMYLRGSGLFGYINGSSIPIKALRSTSWKANVWHEYKFIVDLDRGILDFYFNGELIGEDIVLTGVSAASTVSFKTKRNGGNECIGNTYFDDITIRSLTPSDEQSVEFDTQRLDLPESTVNDIDLASAGLFDTMIAWKSDNTDVIDNNGIVTQQMDDTDVVLHATIVKGEITDEKDFTVTVLGTGNTGDIERNEEALKDIADRFSLSKVIKQPTLNITEDISLPDSYSEGDAGRLGGCNISWRSSKPEVLSNTGEVTRGENDQELTLTATFSFAENSEIEPIEKQYMLIVAGEGEYAYQNNFNNPVIFGESADGLDGVEIDDVESDGAAGSGVFYGAWQAPDDLLNGVLGASRNTLSSIDRNVLLKPDFSGRYAEFGMSLYLDSITDRIDVTLEGIDISMYVKGSVVSVAGMDNNVAVAPKQWHKLAVLFDDYYKTYTVYFDGMFVTVGVYRTELEINSIILSNDNQNGSVGTWYADDIYIKDSDVTDEEAIRRTIAELDIADTAEWNITLPNTGKLGAKISWSSEDDSVLDGNGVVTRSVGGDKTITLTASVSRGDAVIDAEFDVVVPGLTGNETPTQEKLEEHVNAIDISELTGEKHNEITKDLDLFGEYIKGNCAFYGGMDVTWSSEFPNVISNTGKVTQPLFDTGVKVTATFTSKRDSSITTVKEFNFIVLAKGRVIYYEDFEDITENQIGQKIDGYKTWTLERQIAQYQGQHADLEIDPADITKPFEEANKAFRISRYRVATANEVLPERAYMNTTAEQTSEILNADAVVLTMNVKFINTISRFDMVFGGLSVMIYPNKIASKISGTYKNGTLTKGDWHTFTFILCPKNEVCYFLIDGKQALTKKYSAIEDRLDVSRIEMHTFRKSGLSDFYVDDISIRVLEDADADAIAKAQASLMLDANITDSVELPSFGEDRTNITWTSQNQDIILNDGRIVGTGDALLTAIIKRGTGVVTKEFNLNVTKTQRDEFSVNELIIDGDIISGATLSCPAEASTEELVVLVYNNDRLVQIRNCSVNGSTVMFDAIDTSEFYDAEVKAYIKRGSEIVSNVLVMNL